MDSPKVLALVARAKERDQTAFGELYDMYAKPIHRFLKLKVPIREQAEDLLQDTFLKAWQALPSLKLQNLYFRAWLYQIARNLVNDHYRKVYRSPKLEDIDDHQQLASASDTSAAACLSLDLARVSLALPNLKPEYRQVLELRFIQEFSIEETARIMGKTRVAIRLVQHRALKKLNQALTTEPSYEASSI